MANYNSAYTGAQIDAAVGAVASKADDTAVVHVTGNETIGGVKTFSSFPVTPSSVPTDNYQVANKKYIDDKVKTDVPVGAKFTDTVYTHPATHSADIIVDGTTNKAFTADEKTKLSGIETGATADMTASEILTAVKTVDGTGSGLDADTLDGSHATAFATSTHTHGNVTNDGKIGSTADLPIFTTTAGALTAKSIADAKTLLGIVAGAQVESGTYSGTGTYGPSDPNTLSFGFAPKVVIVGHVTGSQVRRAIMINNSTLAGVLLCNATSTSANGNQIIVSWGATSVSWYATTNAFAQMNDSSSTGYYIALG